VTARVEQPHPLRVRRRNMRAPLDGAVLVARPSRWANPFWPGACSREEAVSRYAKYVRGRPDLVEQLPTLAGRRLACYCPLDEPCHADVLARLANGELLDR
jgi:Domain of unknown function (DUF4326)